MIVHEDVELNKKIFDYVNSDALLVIRRNDGQEMFDDLQLKGEYTYEETDKPIDTKPINYAKVVAILLGEA